MNLVAILALLLNVLDRVLRRWKRRLRGLATTGITHLIPQHLLSQKRTLFQSASACSSKRGVDQPEDLSASVET